MSTVLLERPQTAVKRHIKPNKVRESDPPIRNTNLKYKTAKELQTAIDSYFVDCEDNKKPMLITGLALWLGVSRVTLINYGKSFYYAEIIAKAKQRCEHFAETQLFTGNHVVGAIFTLKNNYDWRDRTEQDLTSGGAQISFSNAVPRPQSTNMTSKP